MKSKETQAIEVLSTEIQKVVKRFLNTANYDKTVAGIITAVVDDYKYKVKIKEEIFTIPSSLDITFKINEAVWVTIPQNNMRNKYISGRRRT